MAAKHDNKEDFESDVDVESIVDEPKMKKVYLINDDYSTMEFVVDVLMEIFEKSHEEAIALMLKIHKENRGLCGIYPYDIAETKANKVSVKARENGFPLQVVLEDE